MDDFDRTECVWILDEIHSISVLGQIWITFAIGKIFVVVDEFTLDDWSLAEQSFVNQLTNVHLFDLWCDIFFYLDQVVDEQLLDVQSGLDVI